MTIDHEPQTQPLDTQTPAPEVTAPVRTETLETPKGISRRAVLLGIAGLGTAGGLGMMLGNRGREAVTETEPTPSNSATPTNTPETSASPEVVEPPEPELFTEEQRITNALLEKADPETFETKTTFKERLRWVLSILHARNNDGLTYYDFVIQNTRSGNMMAGLNPFIFKYTEDSDGQTIMDSMLYAENTRTTFALDDSEAGELYVPLDTAKARKFVAASYLDPSSEKYQEVADLVETSYTETNYIGEETLLRQVVDSAEWINGGYDIKEGGESINAPAKKITLRDGNYTYEVTAVFLTFDLLEVNVAGLTNNRNNPIDGATDGIWVATNQVVVK